MLLTLTTTTPPADDLSFLLHKHPAKVQTFDLTFGKAHVFYPEVSETRCTAALVKDPQFERLVGLDISLRSLERAAARLHLDQHEKLRERVSLLHGALTYRDDRLRGFDAAVLVEVIEHLDPPRLRSLERVVFEHARPRHVLITTPNREYNVRFASLPAGAFRHRGHRFEWTRAEFQEWANRVAQRFGYTVSFVPIGMVDKEVGPPTQMGVFDLAQGDLRTTSETDKIMAG